MTRFAKLSVPPVAEVRKQLAATAAEVRMLRRLLRLAKDADEAKRLRAKADGGAQ